MPEVAVYLVEKRLAAFCFNSHPLPDIIVFFPADHGQRLDGPFKEFDRVTTLQLFKCLYIPLLWLSRVESRIMLNRHGLWVRPYSLNTVSSGFQPLERKHAWRIFSPTALAHRLLEPLTQRVLAFFELLDFLLQVVADALDARQRSFARQRGLRPVVAVRL
jgi:hypothetical protein